MPSRSAERPLFRIWQAAIRQRYRLLTSPALIREIARVLREDFSWEASRLIRQLKLIVKTGEIVIPQYTLHVIEVDPPDNCVLECAVEGRVHLIVSGDRHLRHLKRYQNIPIVSPTDFLRTLGMKTR